MATRKELSFIAMTAAMLPLVACAGGKMSSDYKKEAVQPIQLSRTADSQLTIKYTMPAESLYYSPGVDFVVDGDKLRVTIVRCGINNACEAMAKAKMPPAEAWHPEVTVPYQGQRVVMVYADGEEQIYP